MGKINSVKKLTDNKFVNLYGVDATSVHDTPVSYFVASRAKSVEDMKLSTGENHPDGVIIYSVYGEQRDKVVLIRQYRYTIVGFRLTIIFMSFRRGLWSLGRISMRVLCGRCLRRLG